MKYIIPLAFLTACSMMPEFAKTVEDIADDTAVKVVITKEAVQKETDVAISVSVQNKDQPKP